MNKYIDFESENRVCTTPCKNVSDTMVGSFKCELCRFFVAKNNRKKFVVCKAEQEIEEANR